MLQASRTPSSTASRIARRIRAKGRGRVHVPTDFLDGPGSRTAVDTALRRLVDAGTLRRIARGLYDYPTPHRFGPRPPSPDAVAAAVARSTGESICHGGAMAAHLLGLSTQVPAQAVYLTSGTSRILRVDLGNGRGFDLHFKKASPSRMLGLDKKAGLVLRALRYLGPDGVDDDTLVRLRDSLDADDLRDLRALRPRGTGWMRGFLDRIAPTA